MSNFDYNTAKLIIFLTTQFGEGKLLNEPTDIAKFINTGANGYVLMPKIDDVTKIGDNYTIEYYYGIDNINTTEGAMDYCVNKLYDFAKKICDLQPDANIWIGTPEINSKNVQNILDETHYLTDSVDTLAEYTIAIKNKFNTSNGTEDTNKMHKDSYV